MPKISKKTKNNPNLTISVYDQNGISVGTKVLTGTVFGQKINQKLLSQAIRVYQTNQQIKPGSTKTRGEVSGGGRKPWRQKGTGRARQGSTRAPHWRGGGIVFGPKPRKTSLALTQKMKSNALNCALSLMASQQKIKIISISKKIDKTKQEEQLLQKIYENIPFKHILLITAQKDLPSLSLRNLDYVDTAHVNDLNTLDVLMHDQILLTEEACKKYESK